MRFHIVLELREQYPGLLPHQRIQSTDILDVERWRERLALFPVGTALREDEPKADDAGEEVPDQPWLFKNRTY